jgi:pyruvate,orthophosphate dikinase
VAFTRNPANGANEFYGEFLINAQGEDVVAGVRTPEPVLKLKDADAQVLRGTDGRSQDLEKHFKDVQDIEFTVQEGKLFMLQTRNGKRTAAAALKFAMDMVKEKLIDWETAILRNPADQLDQLLAPVFDLAKSRRPKSSPPVSRWSGRGVWQNLSSTRIARWLRPRRAKRFCSSASKPPPKTCAA